VRASCAGDEGTGDCRCARLIRQGYNIDLGLGQINSANLGWLGLSVEDAFEPCRNLAAAARVLTTNYQSVAHSAQSSDHAIATALSLYNTGVSPRQHQWHRFEVVI
jgi:soluble lytic murein transglycosylase-like protein